LPGCWRELQQQQDFFKITFDQRITVTLVFYMENELFKFWSGGWKAYAEEEKKNSRAVLPSTIFGRFLKFSKAIFTPVDKSTDKRLF
jgi:hypothetical protein